MIVKVSPRYAHLIGAIAVFITDVEYILNDYKKFMGFSKNPNVEFWIMLSLNICTVPYLVYYYLFKKRDS